MKYTLSRLTEFSHAIIYTFSPESTFERLVENSHLIKDALYPESMQYVDLLNAYLYAQDEVLPEIRLVGLQAITPERWVEIIQALHKKIAEHLLLQSGCMAGIFETHGVFRWHAGNIIFNTMCQFLFEKNYSLGVLKSFCERIGREFRQSPTDLFSFLLLVNPNRTRTDNPAALFKKLFENYHSNELSDKEKEIVEKIAKVGPSPDLIPRLMQAFSCDLHAKLQTLDSRDPRALSYLLGNQFYALTDLHPFRNANGRVATCLMNIILRALDYPSIVLRHPNERTDETSSYFLAMACIDETRELFINHINRRITEPQFEDTHLNALIEQRVLIAIAYDEMWKIRPNFDADAFQREELARFEEYFCREGLYTLSMEILLGNQVVLQQCKTVLAFKYVRESLSARIAGFKSARLSESSLLSPQWTPQQKTQLLAKLQEISGEVDGWNAYSKKAVFLFESKDEEKVKHIARLLTKTERCQTMICRRKDDTRIHVVQVSAIDLHNLLAYEHAAHLVEGLTISKMCSKGSL